MVLEILKIDHINRMFEVYVMENQNTKPFLRRSLKASQPLDIVYSNMCGPTKLILIGGNGYFHTFRDDFSGKT
jgi:hypothetical protein